MPATNKNIKKNVLEKLSSTWGGLITGFTIFGIGFSAGMYISNVISEVDKMEITNKYQKEIIQIQSDYENKLHQLRQDLYEYQNSLLERCKNENKK